MKRAGIRLQAVVMAWAVLALSVAAASLGTHAMHSQVPQILAGFGFQGAIMRTHFMILAAMELLLGGTSREPDLDRAWKNLLVGQHHDIQICGLVSDARKFLTTSIAASTNAASASLQYVASEHILFSALYPDRDQVYARLFNCSGEGVETPVSCLEGKASLQTTDLLGRGEQPAPSPLPFQAWQFRTFRVTPLH